MNNERVYVISPVRQVTQDQAEQIAKYVEYLHQEDYRVFNPVKDAPQDDATGYNIVMAELGFMHESAKEMGRVDILWNAGGIPSEGSRVDIGMAYALGLPFNLIAVFNEDQPTGPQIGYQIIKNTGDAVFRMHAMLLDIVKSSEVAIDWNVEMGGIEQEWQRIRLGLALGCMAKNPNLKIKLGKLSGEDPENKKSYVKVVREIEKRQLSVEPK